MSTVSQMRQESLDKSIFFMQQDHANTLKGLHEEIQKLQKKCSELTFQLAMETTSSPQEDILREKNESLEKELEQTIIKLAEKEHELATKDQRIGDLELKLKAQEKGYKDKLIYLNQMVSKYKRQAEESAAQNADLLLNSHRQNVARASMDYDKRFSTEDTICGAHQHRHSVDDARLSSASSSSSHGSSPRTKSSPKIKPVLHAHAPKETQPLGSGKSRWRTKMGTFDMSEGHPVLRDKDTVTKRAASGRRLSHDDDTMVPDPKPFLQVTREQQKALRHSSADMHKQYPKPLPPIANSVFSTGSNHSNETFSPRPPESRKNTPNVPPLTKADSANFRKLRERNRKLQQGEVSMETLVLDDITKSSVSNLRRAQEYGSD